MENLSTNENKKVDFVTETNFPTWSIEKRKQRPDETTSSRSVEFPDALKNIKSNEFYGGMCNIF